MDNYLFADIDIYYPWIHKSKGALEGSSLGSSSCLEVNT